MDRRRARDTGFASIRFANAFSDASPTGGGANAHAVDGGISMRSRCVAQIRRTASVLHNEAAATALSRGSRLSFGQKLLSPGIKECAGNTADQTGGVPSNVTVNGSDTLITVSKYVPLITVCEIIFPVILNVVPACGDVSVPVMITLPVPRPAMFAVANTIGTETSESLNEPLVKPGFNVIVTVDTTPVRPPVNFPV
jgi:hypothetical protein